jgi:hypothetical protein
MFIVLEELHAPVPLVRLFHCVTLVNNHIFGILKNLQKVRFLLPEGNHPKTNPKDHRIIITGQTIVTQSHLRENGQSDQIDAGQSAQLNLLFKVTCENHII